MRAFCGSLLRWVGALALGAVARAAEVVAADDAAKAPVRIVVPYPISGPTDIRGTSRMTKTYKLMAANAPPAISDTLAQIVTDALRGAGTPVSRLRQPGALTARGAQIVAGAPADGRTLLLGSNATMLINPRYFGGLGYDPMRDFTLVAPLAVMPFVLLAGPSVPVASTLDLVQWAKQRPGDVNYASSGDGSTGHIAGELLRRSTGIQTVHVAYNGGLAALNGVVTGQVSYMFAALPLALPYLGQQHFVALGIASKKRFASLPELATLAESGLPDFDLEGWYGLFAPGRTPDQIVARLHGTIAPAIGSGSARQSLVGQGLEPATATREQFATRINSDTERWAPIVEASRIHLRAGSS